MTTLLCLHGWGADGSAFDLLRSELKETDLRILSPDLPGFGSAPEPPLPWSVDDYADWVLEYIEKQEIEGSLLLLGHSFGGRICIKLTSNQRLAISGQNVDHVYLCAAAGIKRKRHVKRIIGLTLAKSGKILLSIPGFKLLKPLGKKLLYKLVRVHDYEQASPLMRQTMIRVTQEDLRPLLTHIQTPVDLFWGTDDGMTPYSDAKIMASEIPNATLHTYEGVRHRVHKDRAQEIAMVIQTKLSS